MFPGSRTGKGNLKEKGTKGTLFSTKHTHTYKLLSDYLRRSMVFFFSPHEPVSKVMLLPSGHVLNSSSQFHRQHLNLMISRTWYLISNKVWAVFHRSVSIGKFLIPTYVQVENIWKLLFPCTSLICNDQLYYCLFTLVYFVRVYFITVNNIENDITAIYLKVWKGLVPTWHS